MGFAKVRMGKEEIFETIVKDIDGKVIEKWMVLKQDFGKVVNILAKKFGLDFITVKKKRDDDLSWATR